MWVLLNYVPLFIFCASYLSLKHREQARKLNLDLTMAGQDYHVVGLLSNWLHTKNAEELGDTDRRICRSKDHARTILS